MSKFEIGDRVVWARTGIRGVILDIFKIGTCSVGFDVENPEDTGRATLKETSLVEEHVYDSPLWSALR